MAGAVYRNRAPWRGEARRRAGDRGAGRWGQVFAALDLGTNNCRLLVARPAGPTFRVIDAFSRIVRLGEGMGERGEITEAAMERTLEALKVCARKMQRRAVTRSRAVATEACRRAINCDAFLGAVSRETGLELEIISTAEEAQLAVAGCRPLIVPEAHHALVFDIGGGSTELIWLDTAAPDGLATSVSLPIGVVTLAERYGGHDVSPKTYRRMVDEVTDGFRAFAADHPIAGANGDDVQMIGTSGTVTTLAGIELALPRYDRSRVDGLWLEFERVRALSEGLRALDYAGRAAQACIGPERADLVIGGCAILEAICRLWPVGRLRVADRGIREGILQALMHAADLERDGAGAGG